MVKRNRKDLVGRSSSPIINQYLSAQEEQTGSIPEKPQYNFGGLLDKNVLNWFVKSIPAIFRSHAKYTTYPQGEGVFPMASISGKNNAQVALIADWASCTVESESIAELVKLKNPEYSVHLGDTYFIGNEKQVEENFGSEGAWPYAPNGTFALLGNHEMYSGGEGYFKNLLPYMGIKTDGKITGPQKAPFFCLENDYWRIIGIDTGYDCLSGLFKNNVGLKLPNELIEWLENTVKLNDDKRGLIFLSHHQYCSAFKQLPGETQYDWFSEEEFQQPAMQLAKIIGQNRPVLWLWGHEHRLAIYGSYQAAGGITAYGRCIGNGGMPCDLVYDPSKAFGLDLTSNPNDLIHYTPQQVSARKIQAQKSNLVLHDNRFVEEIMDVRLGHNGYAMLSFNNEALTIDYYDDSLPQPIISEKWAANLATGAIKGISIVDNTKGTYPNNDLDTSKLFHFTPDINDAIK